MKNGLKWGLPIAAAVVALILWTCVALLDSERTMLPGPLAVALAFSREFGVMLPLLGRDVGAMIVGFLLASVCGLGTAIALATYRGLDLALTPWFAISRMTPLLVLTPLIIVSPAPTWLALVVITTIICYFPVVAIVLPGLTGVDKALEDQFKLYRATYWQELRHLRLPHALPHMMRALRRAAILAPLAALLTDFLAGALVGRSGLGSLLRDYQAANQIPEIYALCLTAAVIGVALAGAVDAVASWVLDHWHDSDHGTH